MDTEKILKMTELIFYFKKLGFNYRVTKLKNRWEVVLLHPEDDEEDIYTWTFAADESLV